MTKATAWALAIGAVVGLIITGKMVMDATSAGRIARLHPRMRGQARQLLSMAAGRGIDLRVTSGLRTYEEQAALYAQGRTKPGNVVTNAPPGHSWHNFGLAFDVVPWEDGRLNWNTARWTEIGQMGKSLGLQWGGDWTGLVDKPHFQAPQGLSLSDARSRISSGRTDGEGYILV